MHHTMHLWPGVAKQPNLELKTLPKQLLGSLPLVIALPGHSDECHSDECHSDECHSDECHSLDSQDAKFNSPYYHSDKCHSPQLMELNKKAQRIYKL